jgi:hypothetical protein
MVDKKVGYTKAKPRPKMAEMTAKSMKFVLNGKHKMAKPCSSIPQKSITFLE